MALVNFQQIVIILNAFPFNISGNVLFALLRFEQLKNVIVEKQNKLETCQRF